MDRRINSSAPKEEFNCRICKQKFKISNRAKEPLMVNCITGVLVCENCESRVNKINARNKLGLRHDPRWKNEN